MSYWDHCKPELRTRAVTVDALALASSELLDTGGLRALTVRAVAGRLGVAPASLYSRIEGVADLYDLGLDEALAADSVVQCALAQADLHRLLLAYYRHLVAHRWACQVIAMRAPRGPAYLALSERMCVLLGDWGIADPMGAAYVLSNFVIGSATTAPISQSEQESPVDPELAPFYYRSHLEQSGDFQSNVTLGIHALMQGWSQAGGAIGPNA